jgi:glutamyl-tRNA synthetase
MKEIRTRFAPSPTGFLHVGSARTAFYAWLLARHYNGKFLLRVEDTDQERLVPGAIRSLIEELTWFGIEIDEGPSPEEFTKLGEDWHGMPVYGGDCGPYIQSLRLARYREVAEELIAKGYCYRCDCTSEMLEKERQEQAARKELPGYAGRCRNRQVPAGVSHVVRFRMPENKTVVLEDVIRGRITWDNASLRDSVLLKSDGYPTYHLAVVVDDHDMRISHVLRGEEWLATAPLHVLLYEALGWEAPGFAHLPVILGSGGKKLSKREGAVFSSLFREQGYLADALLNYLALVGWSPGEGNEQEIFTRAELIEKFTLEHVNQASGHFDYDKLQWMNGAYIRNLPAAEFISLAKPFIEKAGLNFNAARFAAMAPHIQERAKLLAEVPAMMDYLFLDRLERDIPAMFTKGVDRTKAVEILKSSIERIEQLSRFEVPLLEEALRPLAELMQLKVGPVFGVLRIAVTGKKISPPLFDSFVALGKEETLRRLQETLALLG